MAWTCPEEGQRMDRRKDGRSLAVENTRKLKAEDRIQQNEDREPQGRGRSHDEARLSYIGLLWEKGRSHLRGEEKLNAGRVQRDSQTVHVPRPLAARQDTLSVFAAQTPPELGKEIHPTEVIRLSVF